MPVPCTCHVNSTCEFLVEIAGLGAGGESKTKNLCLCLTFFTSSLPLHLSLVLAMSCRLVYKKNVWVDDGLISVTFIKEIKELINQALEKMYMDISALLDILRRPPACSAQVCPCYMTQALVENKQSITQKKMCLFSCLRKNRAKGRITNLYQRSHQQCNCSASVQPSEQWESTQHKDHFHRCRCQGFLVCLFLHPRKQEKTWKQEIFDKSPESLHLTVWTLQTISKLLHSWILQVVIT